VALRYSLIVKEQRNKAVDLRILFKRDNLTSQEINILRAEMEVNSGIVGDALSYKLEGHRDFTMT